MAGEFIPYCGSPPLPGATAWNLDPLLICALVGVAGAYAAGIRRLGSSGPDRIRQIAFFVGWFVIAASLLSPLCNLSVALFSARVGQHMVITLVGVPLIVFGQVERVLAGVLIGRAKSAVWWKLRKVELAAGPIAFAVALWVWHSPLPYEASLRSDGVYWLMHLTLIGSAIVLWRALLDDFQVCPACGLLASFFTSVQMSILGALLTFSQRPWFPFHASTTAPWGLSSLEDQQLGGLLMWVPGGMVLLVYALAVFGAHLGRSQPQPASQALAFGQSR